MKKNVLAVIIALLAISSLGLVLITSNRKSSPPPISDHKTPVASTENKSIKNEPTVANAVTLQKFSFSPSKITVKKGTTVTWTNQDDAGHTVTSDSGNMLSSPLFRKAGKFTYTFNETGSFSYHCEPHPYMKAVVEVVE